MENVEGVKKKSKRKESRYGKRYGFEFKLRCVKLRLEEGIPPSLLSKEVGTSKDVIRRWAKAYEERGEAGLRNGVIPAGSQIKKLEILSQRTGMSASEIIRRAIDEYWDRKKGKKGGV